MNIYDVRLDDTAPACGMNWPTDLVNITSYLGVSAYLSLYTYIRTQTLPLQRKDVVSALHATAKSESWAECRGRIHAEFDDKSSASSIELIPKVLEKIPMLFFAGDQDFICNYVGIESMIKAMSWNGGTGLGVSYFSLGTEEGC